MARNSNSKFGRTFGLTRHLAERGNPLRTSSSEPTSKALPNSLALQTSVLGGTTPRTSVRPRTSKSVLRTSLRTSLLALAVPLFCTFGFFGTSMAFGTGSAFAGEAWWHLTSGARPAYLHAGGKAVDEVQEMTVNATEGRCSSCRPWWKISEH
jgi:hypothetical protein